MNVPANLDDAMCTHTLPRSQRRAADARDREGPHARWYAVFVALLAASPVAAQDDALSAARGLPQIVMFEGRAATIRYLTLRGPSTPIGFELKLPECVPTPTVAMRAGPGVGGSGECTSSGSTGAATFGMEQLRVTAGRRFADVLDAQVAVRAWRSRSAIDRKRRGDRGLAADVELGGDAGMAYAFVGHSEPVSAADPAAAWRVSYAGLEWQPTSASTIEWVFDVATPLNGTGHDRSVTLRYAMRAFGRVGLRLQIARMIDDPVERWRSGVGLEWVF